MTPNTHKKKLVLVVFKKAIAVLSVAFLLVGCAAINNQGLRDIDVARSLIPEHQRESAWFSEAQVSLNAKLNCDYCVSDTKQKYAKNIILFVGDGMGISTVTASRIYAGQLLGQSGEENLLSFEKMPYTGLVKTYNVDAQVPDSAGTMTAMVTGVKTNFGALSVSEKSWRANCKSQQGKELVTALELAELAGMATGIVSTARITHATPAANYAKASERDWEYKTNNKACEDIASQLIGFEKRLNAQLGGESRALSNGIDVILGGGRRAFLSKPEGGKRTDQRNLIREWLQSGSNRVALESKKELTNHKDFNQQLLGLFASSHMAYDADRRKNYPEQPSLTEMTAKALDLLERKPKGYYLQVESGRIDHGHHAGNAFSALNDTVEFSRAIQSVLDRVDFSETLVIVTADHSHVMTMAGYPRRGNNILGYVNPIKGAALAEDGKPYTTLSYANGRGVRDLGDKSDADLIYRSKPVAGRSKKELTPTLPGYHQEALVPLMAETHGGEDVAIYAAGPGAHLVTGVIEQNFIFHIMNHAGQLELRAKK